MSPCNTRGLLSRATTLTICAGRHRESPPRSKEDHRREVKGLTLVPLLFEPVVRCMGGPVRSTVAWVRSFRQGYIMR